VIIIKNFTVQYSVMGKNPVATTWKEYTKQIFATSAKDAVHRFNHNRKGNPWMVLDCWEN